MYRELVASLRRAYDRNARERETYRLAPWKIEERDHFLTLLQEGGKRSLHFQSLILRRPG